jgi:hypothetical protein
MASSGRELHVHRRYSTIASRHDGTGSAMTSVGRVPAVLSPRVIRTFAVAGETLAFLRGSLGRRGSCWSACGYRRDAEWTRSA